MQNQTPLHCTSPWLICGDLFKFTSQLWAVKRVPNKWRDPGNVCRLSQEKRWHVHGHHRPYNKSSKPSFHTKCPDPPGTLCFAFFFMFYLVHRKQKRQKPTPVLSHSPAASPSTSTKLHPAPWASQVAASPTGGKKTQNVFFFFFPGVFAVCQTFRWEKRVKFLELFSSPSTIIRIFLVYPFTREKQDLFFKNL